jgi:hypothetical protein
MLKHFTPATVFSTLQQGMHLLTWMLLTHHQTLWIQTLPSTNCDNCKIFSNKIRNVIRTFTPVCTLKLTCSLSWFIAQHHVTTQPENTLPTTQSWYWLHSSREIHFPQTNKYWQHNTGIFWNYTHRAKAEMRQDRVDVKLNVGLKLRWGFGFLCIPKF